MAAAVGLFWLVLAVDQGRHLVMEVVADDVTGVTTFVGRVSSNSIFELLFIVYPLRITMLCCVVIFAIVGTQNRCDFGAIAAWLFLVWITACSAPDNNFSRLTQKISSSTRFLPEK